MKILSIPDIHGDIDKLEQITELIGSVDLVLLVGDLTNFGRAEDAAAVVERVSRSNGNILAVPGNCDYPEVEWYLSERGLNLDGRHQVRNGMVFAGLGASLYSPSRGTPNEVSDEILAERLDAIAADLPNVRPLVLVSHQPPLKTVNDRVCEGLHVGSASVRRFIETRSPLICFTGHIHEGIGQDWIGVTPIINPGPFYQGRFAVADVGATVESIDIRRL
jgi:uncharacterized protein